MGIAVLEERLKQNQCTSDVLSEIAALADQAIQEIRTTSYLLHPPLLDEAGFNSAAQWYVDGFGKRSGIEEERQATAGQVPGLLGARRIQRETVRSDTSKPSMISSP
jgi:signal transduction histidine kinase